VDYDFTTRCPRTHNIPICTGKVVQPLWKAVIFLKRLEIELPYDPVIPLLGIYPKECKTG
jgi:hypothetical protein